MGPVTPGVQRENANTSPSAPSASVAAVAIEFPPHQVGQREALSGLTGLGGPQFDRFGDSAGVQTRRISLPLQRNDFSIANLVATSLFGDAAGAVVAKGSALTPTGPRLLATRSRLYPDTEEVMGWNIGSNGFQIKLSAEVATVAEKYLGEDVRNFLADQGLTPADISTWICHPGGPKV